MPSIRSDLNLQPHYYEACTLPQCCNHSHGTLFTWEKSGWNKCLHQFLESVSNIQTTFDIKLKNLRQDEILISTNYLRSLQLTHIDRSKDLIGCSFAASSSKIKFFGVCCKTRPLSHTHTQTNTHTISLSFPKKLTLMPSLLQTGSRA